MTKKIFLETLKSVLGHSILHYCTLLEPLEASILMLPYTFRIHVDLLTPFQTNALYYNPENIRKTDLGHA